MKKIILGIASIIWIAASAQIPNYVPTNGLVGWYPFSGNANDYSGNGNNGTVNGASLYFDRFGNSNSAYAFTNLSCSITTNYNPVSLPPYTISAWVKILFPDPSSFNPIITLGGNGGVCFAPDYRRVSGHGCPSLIHAYMDCTSATGIVDEGRWYHVVVTVSSYSSGDITFYVDGVASTQNNMYGGLNSGPLNNSGFVIGEYTGTYFNGMIDDLGLWNRVLTQQEITSLYNAVNCTPPTAFITASGNTTFCPGDSVTLTAGGGSAYSWSNGSTNQSITANQSNTYAVTVTDSSGCSATASQLVTVSPNPPVSLSLPTITNLGAAPFVMNGNPSGGTYTGAGVSGSSFNPSNAGLGLKSVSYTYTNGNGCSGSTSSTTLVYDTTGVVCTSYDTVTTTVNDTVTAYLSVNDTLKINVNLTGITPPQNTNTLTVYPNPTHDHLLIDNGNLSSMNGYSIKITNALGQVVFNQPVTQQSFYIDLSTWGGYGTYLLYVIESNQTVKEVKKIVLQ